jgi:hypothetical protein
MSCSDDMHCVSFEGAAINTLSVSGVLSTTDGGQIWSSFGAQDLQPPSDTTELTIDSISCPTALHCWASGLLYTSLCQGSCPYAPTEGKLFESVDGGRTWREDQLPSSPNPNLQYGSVWPLDCVSGGNCFAVGSLELTKAASDSGLSSSLQQDVVLSNARADGTAP